tara:strand:- start:254 stop:601 length:348 start_codon:yes stop_codon:yes gene_type:complete
LKKPQIEQPVGAQVIFIGFLLALCLKRGKSYEQAKGNNKAPNPTDLGLEREIIHLLDGNIAPVIYYSNHRQTVNNAHLLAKQNNLFMDIEQVDWLLEPNRPKSSPETEKGTLHHG